MRWVEYGSSFELLPFRGLLGGRAIQERLCVALVEDGHLTCPKRIDLLVSPLSMFSHGLNWSSPLISRPT